MPLIGGLGIISAKTYGFTALQAAPNPNSIDILTFQVTPLGTAGGPINNYFRRYVYKVIFTAAEIQSAGWTTSETIRRISFYVTSQPTYQPYPSYAVGMINTNLAVGSDFTTGITTVKNQASTSFTVNQENILVLDTTFNWDGTSNLGISFAWGQSPTNWSQTGVVQSNTSGSGRYTRTDSAGTYLISDAAGTTQTGRPCIKLYKTAS